MTSNRNQSRPDFPSLRVFEVVDVVGRAVDVATEPQLVGLLPRVVGLGLDGRAVGGWDRCIDVHSTRTARSASPPFRLLASTSRAWPS